MCIFSEEPYFPHINKEEDAPEEETEDKKTLDEIIQQIIPKLSRINSPTTPDEYIEFKENVLRRASASELLGISPFRKENPQERYENLKKVLDPDKNPYRREEASQLLMCLNAAYATVDKKDDADELSENGGNGWF